MILAGIMLLVWILTIIGWVIYNLYQKNLKLESTVIAQANFIGGLQSMIGESEKALKGLDDKIWMESDSELQTVFQNLKAVENCSARARFQLIRRLKKFLFSSFLKFYKKIIVKFVKYFSIFLYLNSTSF